ncbi:MAG: transposase [Methylobacter sp.]|nr:transposase [Methylobacter sp.]MDP2099357.1 transposase [Methylobacter sp.]MDP2427293.1 transposase [Methylobacter sp.]MDP3054872.1 transposase [Methylobacter sp.]MDP3364092.1 transposase [Methylobacter sp.]
MERKDYLHNPTHIFMDDTLYFITASIYKKRPLLQDSTLKELLLNNIKSCFECYQWELHHWVILDNHYHLLGKSRKGNDLSHIIQKIHSNSGYYIKQNTKTEEQVWWNYWDYCPRNEKDYFVHLNYLLNNPIKHGYVNKLQNYHFSSFHQYIKIKGRGLLVKQFKNYSDYKELNFYEDDF